MAAFRSAQQMRDDALAIWQAGVAAVRGDRLVMENVQVVDDLLLIAGHEFKLHEVDRLLVVGAGKACAGMARGLEEALGRELLQRHRVQGWVNVPADCVGELQAITLHAARPAGRNEPTLEGVLGAEKMLEMVSQAGPRDLCVCLISGGGSALLPAPVAGVTLADKLAMTRFLSAAGANIRELNTVRTHISRIKGGGLARACRAGHLVSLILSDVPGDPLELIASGPTVPQRSTPAEALAILSRFDPQRTEIPQSIYEYLEQHAGGNVISLAHERNRQPQCHGVNEIIGNLAVAVDAAGVEAERRGYSHAMLVSRETEGAADEVGRHLARQALAMRREHGPDCLLTGGEPVVKLAPAAERGRGGRNQQLVLAAADEWLSVGASADGMLLLSGGTDGEDGPTDAAGAVVDCKILETARQLQLSTQSHLARNDAWTFFEACGGLLRTGPTHTNVCDIRVVLVDRIDRPQTIPLADCETA